MDINGVMDDNRCGGDIGAVTGGIDGGGLVEGCVTDQDSVAGAIKRGVEDVDEGGRGLLVVELYIVAV